MFIIHLCVVFGALQSLKHMEDCQSHAALLVFRRIKWWMWTT